MKRKLKLYLVLVTALSISILSVIRINRSIDAHAETTLKNTVYECINDTIHAYIETNSEKFSDAVKHEYDDSGALVCISLNSAVINNIRTGMEKEIIKTVSDIKNKQFYLSTGSLTGIKLLSGKGPKIKMKIAPLGTLSCNAINTFESVGINHTLHKVGYEFNISFHAAAPFGGEDFETKFFVLICESIIVGKVPSVYFN